MSRILKVGEEQLNMDFVQKINEQYEEKHHEESTMHLGFNMNVLGNKAGAKGVQDETRDVFDIFKGSSYVNGKVTIPFTEEFVYNSGNLNRIKEATNTIANKFSGIAGELQAMIDSVDLKAGREVAMRSQAVRLIKAQLELKGSQVDSTVLERAINAISAAPPSKLSAEFSVNLSGRNAKGAEDKKGWKMKQITDSQGSDVRQVAYFSERGLKKVPIYKAGQRNVAEKKIMDIAKVFHKHLATIEEYDPSQLVNALELIAVEIPGNEVERTSARFTEEELAKIDVWAKAALETIYDVGSAPTV